VKALECHYTVALQRRVAGVRGRLRWLRDEDGQRIWLVTLPDGYSASGPAATLLDEVVAHTLHHIRRRRWWEPR